MFADTLTITIDGVGKVLSRINQDQYGSEYYLRETTGDFRLKVKHNEYVDKTRGATVNRHFVDFVHTVYPVSPATLSTKRHIYTVIEDQTGDDLVAFLKEVLGFVGFFIAANNTKLVNWES